MGSRLGELIEEYGVLGAQVAMLNCGNVSSEAAGVLSGRTQVEVTDDSLFKVESITKVWTATLVQHLVDDGLLDLDAQVGDHPPAFPGDQGVKVPDFGNGAIGWGLGWMRYRVGVGHTGVSKGQKAFLRVDVEQKRAVAVLTNSVHSELLAHDVISEFHEQGSTPVPPDKPEPIDAQRMCGTYRDQLYDFGQLPGHTVTTTLPRL
ncbi:serine hydrolase [Lentzea sp. JNUCC 0626]|uniref:serine hydrolase n=1 Tax=Lentzea sp. JNUCC 0626 TaxID=3367513 RepID=UPI0037493657